jgi:hypothetical protein
VESCLRSCVVLLSGAAACVHSVSSRRYANLVQSGCSLKDVESVAGVHPYNPPPLKFLPHWQSMKVHVQEEHHGSPVACLLLRSSAVMEILDSSGLNSASDTTVSGDSSFRTSWTASPSFTRNYYRPGIDQRVYLLLNRHVMLVKFLDQVYFLGCGLIFRGTSPICPSSINHVYPGGFHAVWPIPHRPEVYTVSSSPRLLAFHS